MSDILDTIDGAIADWETSGDAMRWVPEGSRSAQVVGPYRLTSELRDGVLHVRIEFDAQMMTEAMQRINAAMARLSEQFQGLTYNIEPPLISPQALARERALQAMRERGHGPQAQINRRLRNLP